MYKKYLTVPCKQKSEDKTKIIADIILVLMDSYLIYLLY